LLLPLSRRRRRRRRSQFQNTCWKGCRQRSRAKGRSELSSRSWRMRGRSRSKWGRTRRRSWSSESIRCRWPVQSLKPILHYHNSWMRVLILRLMDDF
jgi:hypothetical protein